MSFRWRCGVLLKRWNVVRKSVHLAENVAEMHVGPGLSKLVDAVRSGDTRKRRDAIDQFSSARMEDAFMIVEPLLSSPDAAHRIAGIEALTGNMSECVVRWLAEHVESDPAEDVRLECLRQLDDIPSNDSRSTFLKKTTDPERRVRQFAASGLRHYVDDEVTRALAMFLVDDDVYVQERAIESLALFDRPGTSYLMHLILPLWEGTYWEPIIRPRANAHGERVLVDELTAWFQRNLLKQASPAAAAFRWMSLVAPEEVLSFAEKHFRTGADEAPRESIRALSELLRVSAQLRESRERIHERCLALLSVIAGRDDQSDVAEESRRLLDRWKT